MVMVRDADEALRVANSTRYGLAASVFTSRADVARRFAAGIEHFHSRYKSLVDFWQLYGNASTPPVLIAEGGLT